MSKIIDAIIEREGGYSNRAADRGGPTNYGITAATLGDWRGLGRPATADEVKAMDRKEAVAIYTNRYVLEPGYGGIRDEVVRDLVVDCAVQFWTDDASPWLQQAANMLGADLAVDGKIGPKTLAAVNALPRLPLVACIMALRIQKRGHVIASDARAKKRVSDQALNAHGWANRDADLLITAAGGS